MLVNAVGVSADSAQTISQKEKQIQFSNFIVENLN